MRIVNLLRVFNIRHGHTAEMDAPSPRYGSAPVDGPSQGKSIMPHWNEARRKYYEEIGWDGDTGHPSEDTLKHYGLDHVIPELRELQSAPQKAKILANEDLFNRIRQGSKEAKTRRGRFVE
jgi:hypothetical protein